MKYIKKFENTEDKPKVGDYVLISIDNDEENDFYSNNPGQIIKFFTLQKYRFTVMISYGKNIPDNMKNILLLNKRCGYYKIFDYEDIFIFSKNKEDLKLKIASNKFNL